MREERRGGEGGRERRNNMEEGREREKKEEEKEEEERKEEREERGRGGGGGHPGSNNLFKFSIQITLERAEDPPSTQILVSHTSQVGRVDFPPEGKMSSFLQKPSLLCEHSIPSWRVAWSQMPVCPCRPHTPALTVHRRTRLCHASRSTMHSQATPWPLRHVWQAQDKIKAGMPPRSRWQPGRPTKSFWGGRCREYCLAAVNLRKTQQSVFSRLLHLFAYLSRALIHTHPDQTRKQ